MAAYMVRQNSIKLRASFVADWCGLVAKDATKNLDFGHFSKKIKKNYAHNFENPIAILKIYGKEE